MMMPLNRPTNETHPKCDICGKPNNLRSLNALFIPDETCILPVAFFRRAHLECLEEEAISMEAVNSFEEALS